MGGTSCHYSSFSSDNGCTSYPSNSLLSAGAIVGIVIGSLVGIAVVILLLVFAYKLSKRNLSSIDQPHYPNVYNVPMNRDTYQQSMRRSDMHTPSKSPIYSERPMNDDFYENA